MDEMMRMKMMMTTTIRSSENPPIHCLATSSYPTWKLYENPFYTPNQHQQSEEKIIAKKPIHRLHLPVSARKIAASFWDLTLIRPLMETELEISRAKIGELKAELELERKARKKAENTMNKMARELLEERKGREALERACGALAKVITADKAEMDKMKKEMEEERKMLRMAEVLREERVQMKLAEAKLVLEEKMLELESTKHRHDSTCLDTSRKNASAAVVVKNWDSESYAEKKYGSKGPVLAEKTVASCSSNTDSSHNSNNETASAEVHPMVIQRSRGRGSPEPENPHIKRGIKGFVEFPKVVRAVGSKRSKRMGCGPKLECEKAQVRILLTQRRLLSSPPPSFITT